MIILPAIDLYGGKAVRLYKGEYDQMTVYDDEPVNTAKKFEASGASWLHMVDLEGAKTGETPNMQTAENIIKNTSLSVEIGGGVRTMDVIERYIDAGVSRVILGTAAVTDPELLKRAVERYGEKIAVGADIKDGYVAIKGWTEKSQHTLHDFCRDMGDIGVKTMICTDISKDGAMQGANRDMYRELSRSFNINFIASGGVSSLEDVIALRDMGLYGAIIGKAYYTGAIDIAKAVEVAK